MESEGEKKKKGKKRRESSPVTKIGIKSRALLFALCR
jgi:hypothetical protein